MSSPAALILLNLFCVFVGVSSNTRSIIIPCKKSDEICMTKSANIAIPLLTVGIPSLNIEPIDPVRVPDKEGEISSLKFKMSNVVGYNYSKCSISNLKFNLDALKLRFDLYCPSIVLEGHFKFTGEILNVIVEGDGPFKLISGKYLVTVEADIEKVKGSDGEMHMAIKPYNTHGGPLEPIQINYNIITKGSTSPEAANRTEQEKLNGLLQALTPSFIFSLFDNFFKIINKYLETIPFDNLFID